MPKDQGRMMIPNAAWPGAAALLPVESRALRRQLALIPST